MSHQAHRFVAGLPADATTDGEQRTLRALADHHNHRSGLLYPSLGTMTKRTGFPARTLRRHYAKFIAEGWLAVLDQRRQVMAFPSLLKTPWKGCGKRVDGRPGGSAEVAPGIPHADPVGPLLALCDAPVETCGPDQDLNRDLKRERTEGAGAPPTLDDVRRFQAVKAGLESELARAASRRRA